jgi:hypothetical protein
MFRRRNTRRFTTMLAYASSCQGTEMCHLPYWSAGRHANWSTNAAGTGHGCNTYSLIDWIIASRVILPYLNIRILYVVTAACDATKQPHRPNTKEECRANVWQVGHDKSDMFDIQPQSDLQRRCHVSQHCLLTTVTHVAQIDMAYLCQLHHVGA